VAQHYRKLAQHYRKLPKKIGRKHYTKASVRRILVDSGATDAKGRLQAGAERCM
jgi:hypothetical protein